VELGHRGLRRHPEEIPRKKAKAQDWYYLYIYYYKSVFYGLLY
jgi:hypothetical protein